MSAQYGLSVQIPPRPQADCANSCKFAQTANVQGKKADQKVYATWDQEKWVDEHTLRRPTIKGRHTSMQHCIDIDVMQTPYCSRFSESLNTCWTGAGYATL